MNIASVPKNTFLPVPMITFCIVVGWAWVERPSIPRTTVAKHYLFFFERAARKLLQSFIRRKRKNKNKNNFTINQPAMGVTPCKRNKHMK